MTRTRQAPTDNLNWCSCCKKFLDKAEFWGNSYRKNNLQSCCKECQNMYTNDWRGRHWSRKRSLVFSRPHVQAVISKFLSELRG